LGVAVDINGYSVAVVGALCARQLSARGYHKSNPCAHSARKTAYTDILAGGEPCLVYAVSLLRVFVFMCGVGGRIECVCVAPGHHAPGLFGLCSPKDCPRRRDDGLQQANTDKQTFGHSYTTDSHMMRHNGRDLFRCVGTIARPRSQGSADNKEQQHDDKRLQQQATSSTSTEEDVTVQMAAFDQRR
jgi:hypothetical protein